MAAMVGRKPGPAPLPLSEKREAIALVNATPGERAELKAWAAREGKPVGTLLREAGLRAARRGGTGDRPGDRKRAR